MVSTKIIGLVVGVLDVGYFITSKTTFADI